MKAVVRSIEKWLFFTAMFFFTAQIEKFNTINFS